MICRLEVFCKLKMSVKLKNSKRLCFDFFLILTVFVTILITVFLPVAHTLEQRNTHKRLILRSKNLVIIPDFSEVARKLSSRTFACFKTPLPRMVSSL